jgi:hypothetical protein
MGVGSREDAVNHKLRLALPKEKQYQPLNQTTEKQRRQEQSTRKGRGCQIKPSSWERKLVDRFLVLPCTSLLQ